MNLLGFLKAFKILKRKGFTITNKLYLTSNNKKKHTNKITDNMNKTAILFTTQQ